MVVVTAVLACVGLVLIALVAALTRRAATRRPDAWIAGHRAAAPLLAVVTAVALAAVVMVLAVLAGTGMAEESEETVFPLVLGTAVVGYVLSIGLLLAATAVANRAARTA